MWPEPRRKLDALLAILAQHRGKPGVVFFRYIRALDEVAGRLRTLGVLFVFVHGEQKLAESERALARFRRGGDVVLLITRDTGQRGLDLPEGEFAIFYSPKAREDVTWQEVSRIRSTIRNPKLTYMLFYAQSGEAEKIGRMVNALQRTAHSTTVQTVDYSHL